jgi:type I restriction enzyme S subunit
VITDGTHYTPKAQEHGRPFLTVKDMLDGCLDFANCSRISEGDFQDAIRNGCGPRAGDVLFSKDGTVGKVHTFTLEEDCAVLSSIAILRPKTEILDQSYFAHFLRSEAFLRKALRNKTGSAIRRIILANLRNLEIPLPPLEEQRHIAAILDKVASIHKTAGQAEARIGQLEASVFDRYFGIDSHQCTWEEGPLSAFCNLITDGEHQTPERTQAGIKLLSARNIQNGKLDYGKVGFVPEHEFARISRRCAPRRGDILISCSGSIGRVAAYDSDEPVALVRSVALVRPKPDKLRPLFLEFLLRTPRMQAMMQRSANASSQANLFQGPIKALQIFSPPLGKQDAFVDEIGRLRNINFNLDRRVTSLRELTNSISDYLLQFK